MKLLLDTHAWIWWEADSPRLSATARATITDPKSELYFSAVSAWEIAIKLNLGKLQLPVALNEFLQNLRRQRVAWLGLEPAHCVTLESLPLHHRDPFDRLLVAQALAEGLALLSSDPALDPYPVPRVW